ncbi:putative Glycine cleavage H-protein [Syntrophobacter sp. SbD1]|nr:putative Glycine cleavage H-protein [Syntrophobacter sp. SbD1]
METKDRKRTLQPVIFSMENDQCVWGRAGVIKPTKCVNAFDCLGCSLDQRVLSNFDEQRKAGGRSANRPARMLLMMRTGKCRHMLSGRIPYGSCSYAYNCEKCPFDQMIEDTSYMPNVRHPEIERASGFDVARNYYYHHGHTWARVEYGGRVRVGLDDFALRLLGPQDEITIPALGATVGQSRPAAVLKRSGKEAASLSPVDGHVVATNNDILKRATIANDAPYAEGWLMVIQPKSLRNNLKNLHFDSEGMAFIDNEASRLSGLLSGVTGHPTMPTGGEALKDIFGAVPDIGWDKLVHEFME